LHFSRESSALLIFRESQYFVNIYFLTLAKAQKEVACTTKEKRGLLGRKGKGILWQQQCPRSSLPAALCTCFLMHNSHLHFTGDLQREHGSEV